MHILLKTSVAAAIALTGLANAPAHAGEDIVVQSAAAMEEWSQSVTHSLDRRLLLSKKAMRADTVNGFVQLRFTLDDRGKAQDIRVYHSSGDSLTDRVASYAVRSLPNLDEAPVRDVHEKTFQANIIFADGFAEYSELSRELAQSEAKRIAFGGEEEEVVALGG
ncbi:energy transducer TonB [Altererythrobacter sp.]|uniref:energy transducer TonB n=1 Tax=Altererythrobacter sp. TaxID=1872480 RepID=UPI003D071002